MRRGARWWVPALALLLCAGCDEDPVPVLDRVWCIEQASRSLLSLPLGEPQCASRGYVAEVLGPIAFDADERLLAVDLLRREVVEVQTSNGFVTPLFSISQAVNPLAMCVTPGNRLYLLDDEARLLQLDRETGAWTRSWPLRPEGHWRALAWLPDDVESINGDLVPAGTLLVWRPLGQGGEVAWLELRESEALAHSLMSTPPLSGMGTSARRLELFGLDAAGGELHRLRLDLRQVQSVQSYPCDPFLVTDIALP